MASNCPNRIFQRRLKNLEPPNKKPPAHYLRRTVSLIHSVVLPRLIPPSWTPIKLTTYHNAAKERCQRFEEEAKRENATRSREAAATRSEHHHPLDHLPRRSQRAQRRKKKRMVSFASFMSLSEHGKRAVNRDLSDAKPSYFRIKMGFECVGHPTDGHAGDPRSAGSQRQPPKPSR